VGVDAHVGPLGVDIRAHAVGLVTEAVAHRILDLEGGEVQTGQRTVLRRHFHLDALLGREPDLPRHLTGGAVQVLLVAVVGVGQLHQHPLRQAAVQVQAHGVAPGGTRHDAATACQQVLAHQSGEVMNLRGQQVLHASGAGEKDLKLHNILYSVGVRAHRFASGLTRKVSERLP